MNTPARDAPTPVPSQLSRTVIDPAATALLVFLPALLGAQSLIAGCMLGAVAAVTAAATRAGSGAIASPAAASAVAVLIAATLVSLIDIALQRVAFALHQSLAPWLVLMVPAAVLFARWRPYATPPTVRAGQLFAAFVAIGALRELLGAGTLGATPGGAVGVRLPSDGLELFASPAGAVLLAAAGLAAWQFRDNHKDAQ